MVNGGGSYSVPRRRRQLLDLNEYHTETDSSPHIDRDTMNNTLFDDTSFHLVEFCITTTTIRCFLLSVYYHTSYT